MHLSREQELNKQNDQALNSLMNFSFYFELTYFPAYNLYI